MSTASAKRVARKTKNSTPLQLLARTGFAVNGLLHILIGLVAITIALHQSNDKSADQTGALSELAAAPGGRLLLWVVVIGLAALGVWLILSAFLDGRGDRTKRAAHIANNLAKGIVYLVIAGTALTFANGGSSSSSASTKGASAGLLATPGGVVIAVLIGLAIVGVGVYFVIKGARRTFLTDIVSPPEGTAHATVFLGVLGYCAKGLSLGAVGVLFIVAAVTADPNKATGLDGALKSFAALPFGMIVLIVIGAGWIAYGLYCFLRARLAKF
ncbi:DUF1206 domain-containing protein [Galbitalea soli]|uniref:DUF1206 domain-containing protein n=1 Tax=Galbitalea soli TaxID=1268042 RepID=UPI0015753C2D|nr:hypothetical protein [Galbitalea soli]